MGEHLQGGEVLAVGGPDLGAAADLSVVVQHHLEALEEEPAAGLGLPQVVVEVPGGEAEGVEAALRVQEEDGRGLLVVDAGVVACGGFGRIRTEYIILKLRSSVCWIVGSEALRVFFCWLLLLEPYST